ncbi:MAG: hypothetical protein AAGI13_05700 [Pseudomonadota bacterium]
MLARADLAREAVPAIDLVWEQLAPETPLMRRIGHWLWHRLIAVPSAAKIARPLAARCDLDGKPIFLDEHNAPFVLLEGRQVYVRVFRAILPGEVVLLTEPDPDPIRSILSPRDRVRLVLAQTLDGWEPVRA